MSKILVDVFVAATSRSIDACIPYEIPLSDATVLLRALLASEPSLGGEAVRDAVLCARESGVPLDPNRSARESGLSNGSRVMMI
jgi:sugar/nucleoside kinase (ribokinase family)